MRWERTPAPLGPSAGNGLTHPDDMAPPAWHRVREVAWHLPRMLAGLGSLGPRGPADGPPALVIPGFLATDRTTMELRRALARAGWRAHPWLLGVNLGAKANTLELLEARLNAVSDGRKVLLVGWSLGGMFARQLAHRCPDKVRAVQQDLFRLYSEGKLKPHVMAAFPIEEHQKALALVRDRKVVGKVVLLMGGQG